ncbi:putative Circadian clock protein KaiB [delta proteobacterium NaphS2]|nr:putative Circadian clock protein KaiB [delta proteobacterium NaphS2]
MLLKLFVTGKTPRSRKTIDNVKSAFKARLSENAIPEVIDVLDRPQQAQEEEVLVTPTLIRLIPTSVRRLIGDFSDGNKAFDLLDFGGETS